MLCCSEARHGGGVFFLNYEMKPYLLPSFYHFSMQTQSSCLITAILCLHMMLKFKMLINLRWETLTAVDLITGG